MPVVLLYNIAPAKAVKIKLLCRQFLFESREVSREDFGKKISFLLGLSEDGSAAEGSDFAGEMLYFAGINGGFLSVFLEALRRKKAPVALKAVQTDANVDFTSAELYRELCAEHEALNKEQ